MLVLREKRDQPSGAPINRLEQDCCKPKRVLVVEDSAVIAGVVRFNLEQVGFEVSIAQNGREALAILQEHDIDLVVTDYQMPEMDGRELCLHMRRDPRWEQTPVVLLTAKGLELDLEALRQELRVLEVFSKPFSPRALRKTVEDCLATAAG